MSSERKLNGSDKKISGFIEPMLAKETDEPFDDKDWLFEIKWDGYRAISEIRNDKLLLYSRNGLNFQPTYPIVVNQLNTIKENVVMDGEIVVLNDEGKPDFQFLQHYSENQDRPIQYCIFDLLELNGKDTKALPLSDRKELLKEIIPPDDPVLKYSGHIIKNGKSFFQVSKDNNLEGIMAKKASSKYFPGSRTSEWLKIKNHKTEEAIIAGYTEPSGSRKYFGSIILAAKKGNKFIYVGNAGTGFNSELLKELYELFQPLVQKNSPFDERIKNNSKITWLRPELICEIKFSEVTTDGKFRHPVFLHLRNDKNINEINMKNIKEKKQPSPKEQKVEKKKQKVEKPSSPIKKSKKGTERIYTFGKNQITVTHPEKIYFPEEKVTKGDVVDYYISMADYILPYLKGRPESLLRNPNGIKGKGFFQKDAANDTPSYVNCKKVHSDSTNKEVNYIVCDNIETLVYMNNLGCIELNPWHSTIKALDKPDYLMIDIDPSDKNSFEQVVQVALTVKKILDKAGAECYCKTSGASGIHVFVPTGKKYTFDQVKDFAYLVCMMANDELKDFTTLERNLSKRSSKQIYMDYLQNRRGQTIASVYSLRPKPGATVSTPLLWEEVKPGLSPKEFTIYNSLERVKKMGDIFKGVLGKGINLKKCIENLE